MNDLIDLREGWGQPEPPSHAAYSAARASLMQQAAAAQAASVGSAQTLVAGQPEPRARAAWFQRRRAGWLTGAIGLTAASAMAAAAVMVNVATTTAGSDHPATAHAGDNPVAVSHLSGRQILLAAATAAAAAPARTGKYWYLKTAGPLPGPPQESWYTRDGRQYVLLPNRKDVYQPSRDCGFNLAGSWLTYGQIKRLPTDPGALKAWIIRSWTREWRPISPCARSDVPASAKPRPPANPASSSNVALTLSTLLVRIPAPPAVRAAAFRALAAMPDVRTVGHADGGVVLAIYGPKVPASKFRYGKAPRGDNGVEKLIIDPATFVLRGEINYQGALKILAARWTNHRPTVVRPSKSLTPNSGNG